MIARVRVPICENRSRHRAKSRQHPPWHRSPRVRHQYDPPTGPLTGGGGWLTRQIGATTTGSTPISAEVSARASHRSTVGHACPRNPMAHRGSPVTSATTSRIFVRSAGESSCIASPRFSARRHASTSLCSFAVTGTPCAHVARHGEETLSGPESADVLDRPGMGSGSEDRRPTHK